ncbi:MAG: hypothetical protein J7L03_07640 [Caldisericaceae bacterium]|nr:hypothetical protein [Caldisericaceae bacterium]
MKNKTDVLRSIYLYAVSLVGLVTFVVGLLHGSNLLIDMLAKSRNIDYLYSELFSSIFAFLGGLFIFLYHWKIIVREGRLGKNKREVKETEEDFWGSLFFYIVSFIGIIIVLSSFIGFGSNIMKANYSYKNVPSNPGQKIPAEPKVTYAPNVEGMIKSAVSMIIGLFVWLVPYLRIEKEYKKNEDKGITEQH